MKNKLLLAAFLVASSSASFGASIAVDLFTDTAAVTPEGVFLGSSFTARIGVYSGGALTTSAVAADIAANWTQVGQVAFASGAAVGYNGYFSTGSLAHTDAFAGQAIWVWLTDGAGTNALLTGVGSYLADSAIPNSVAVSFDKTNIANATFALGSYNSNGVNPATGGTVVLNAIPEPSAALLGAIGALGLLRRRRA